MHSILELTPVTSLKPISENPLGRVIGLALLITALSSASRVSAGQASQEPGRRGPTGNEGGSTFKLHVERNVVLVHAVVRDSKGQAVKNLTKDDFKLFDNRKLQVLTVFSVEAAPTGPAELSGPNKAAAGAAAQTQARPSPPQRYLALYFDDLNMEFEDVVHARDAAGRFLAANLTSSDRVGIFESSGAPGLDFTDDRAKLHEALFKLSSRPRVNPRTECPEISDYQADQMVNFEDSQAFALARDDAINRCGMDPHIVTTNSLRMDAQRALDMYELQAHYCLQNLEDVVRQISILPGQRNIILVSGGFMPLGRQFLLGELVDGALRSQVVISALDPKGLVTLMPQGDASRSHAPSGALSALQLSYAFAREGAASAPLAEIAEGTGGQFFHNNNDLDMGFHRVAGLPEVYYVLGFSPQPLKYDGQFHKLKVELVNQHGLSVQARRGYFAPEKLVNPEDQAKEEIQTALLSHQEFEELPVDIQTEHHRSAAGGEELTVVVHLDVRLLQFHKENGKNFSDLTLVTALFDRDGKVLEAKQTNIGLHVSDANFQQLLENGIKASIPFTVKPGTYALREVVRDAGSGELSALSREVEIPE